MKGLFLFFILVVLILWTAEEGCLPEAPGKGEVSACSHMSLRLIFPSPRSQPAEARGLPSGIPQILPQRACSQLLGEEAESKALSGRGMRRQNLQCGEGLQAELWPGSGCLRSPRKGESQAVFPVLYRTKHLGPSVLGLGKSPHPFPTNSAVCKTQPPPSAVVSCGSGVLPDSAMLDCGQGRKEGVV